MQWDRVKRILLVILLLVDGFLIWNLSQNMIIGLRRDRQTQEHLSALLAGEGLTLADGFSLPQGVTLPGLEAEHEASAEEAAVRALLGDEVVRTEGENGESVYSRADGSVLTITRGGVIEGRIVQQGDPLTKTALQTAAQNVLTGFPTHDGQMKVDEKTRQVTLTAPVAGVPVYDRGLTLTFEKNAVEITGRWTLTLPYTTTGSETYYDAADALLTFAYEAGRGTEIRTLAPGYLLGEENAGRIPLAVCWKIDTNQGAFFLDTSKMTIESAESRQTSVR